jgi:hypothetical protein
MSRDLGFSVACYKGDIPLLRGCLASIRYFAPDAPISLLIDGDCDTRLFERRYGVAALRRNDIKNIELREHSFGYGITKMSALWEAPFERIIHVDADTVLWGDIRKNIPSDEWDFVYNEPHEIITDFLQQTQYFDPKKIFNHIDLFDWERNPYFNSGVFAARVGALDLAEYLKMLGIQRNNEGLFFQDQSYLNIMVFRAFKQGRLKVKQAHLQSVVPALTRGELEWRFKIANANPVPWNRPTVVHWAGPKPYTTNPEVFSLPMDYFREIGMREFGLPGWVPTRAAMRVDEICHRDVPKAVLNAKSMVKRVIGRR